MSREARPLALTKRPAVVCAYVQWDGVILGRASAFLPQIVFGRTFSVRAAAYCKQFGAATDTNRGPG